MTSAEDHRSRWAIIAAAILLALPLVYGSYIALVQPSGKLRATGAPGEYAIDYYRAGGDFSATIFWPAEQVDRKVRKKQWEENVIRFWH